MVIHTIISPMDIFYRQPSMEVRNSDFSTDPYYYLERDGYSSVSGEFRQCKHSKTKCRRDEKRS